MNCRAQPLVHRLSATAFCDPAGQAALASVALFGYALSDLPAALHKPPAPFEFAFSAEVLFPVLFLLLLGTLLTLDYRNSTRHEISRRCGGGITVSSTLGLSSTDLQASYHHWLNQFTAVRYHPMIVLAMQMIVHVQLALKPAAAGCQWAPNLLGLPSTIMLVARVVLARVHADMSLQSMASFASTAMIATVFAVLLAMKDTCYLSMTATQYNPSLLLTAAQAVLHSAIGFIMSPVDMSYVPALAMLIFCTRGSAVYFQFLHLHDGFTSSSDPNLWGLLTVMICTAVTCQIAVALRYHVAGANLALFVDRLHNAR